MWAQAAYLVLPPIGSRCAMGAKVIAVLSDTYLRYASLAFGALAVACVALATGLIIRNKQVPRLRGAVKVVAFLVLGPLLVALLPIPVKNHTMRVGMERQILESLKHIRLGFEQYLQDEHHLPPADSWCDEIAHRVPGRVFQLGGAPDVDCIFAFNKNLDRHTTTDLPPNAVLVIEADGRRNNSGDAELITANRAKFRYPILGHVKYAYVLFVDGTIVKYRLRDGAVAKYKGSYDQTSLVAFEKGPDDFGPFVKQGQTPYSPLRWK